MALESNDIQTSQFFHSLCEGTRVHFTQYRRGDESARPLFDFYCGLYLGLKLENQTAVLDIALDKAMAFFPPCEIGTMPDVILTNSHYKRRLLNHAVNIWRVERLNVPSLFIPCTKSKALGVTMLPQDMTIWVGIELLGCIHQSNSKTVINGVLYVCTGWDARSVFFDVHKRYKKQPGDDTDESDNEAEPVEAEPVLENDEEEPQDDASEDPAEGEIPADLKLSYENTSKWMRLTHARCYGSIQGSTMEDQHILLIDTRAPDGKQRHFSLRHLIVGVSRATHQKYVHIDPSYEALLMSGAREWAHKSMGVGGENPADYTSDDFDDGNDLALYYNDPDESSRVSVLSLMNSVELAPIVPNALDAAVDINDFFDGEGVYEDVVDSDVELDSDGDVVM
jgi:hypothetical protein